MHFATPSTTAVGTATSTASLTLLAMLNEVETEYSSITAFASRCMDGHTSRSTLRIDLFANAQAITNSA
jgi:hypothetical protein